MDKNLNQLLFERHSIRKYTGEDISPEATKQILEAGLLAPSSKSSRPWQFVVVEDKDKLQALAGCKPFGSKPLVGASLAIAICADPEKSDVWIEDCAVAAAMMHLQAAALGVGSCWIQLRCRDNAENEPAQNTAKEILGIPDAMQVPIILSLGISAEQRKPVDPEKLMWEKVHIGGWTTGQE
ncbi:MAG: nitroreductase family protein [Clostridium sp.]|nr:nitroreductase family protein [Clostridium sp.]